MFSWSKNNFKKNQKHFRVLICHNSAWSRLRVSRAADCDRAFLWSKQSLYFVTLTENTSILNLLFRLIGRELFLQLLKIISFNLEVNHPESWRSIGGAETLGWISFNYLSIGFISIYIIHIRLVDLQTYDLVRKCDLWHSFGRDGLDQL